MFCRDFYKDIVGNSNVTSPALDQIGIFQRAQRTFIDYIYTMTDEDIQLLIGFIERMKHTDE